MARKAKQDSDDEPKKVAMHTLKLDSAQATKLRGILVAKGWVSFPVEHSAFAFKGENLNIVHYKSGKCVISGKGTEEFVKFTLEPDVTGQAVLGYDAEPTKVAPAARYSASVNPAVNPADFCTTTSAPSATQRRHKLGVIETRVSPILISFGTPIFMCATQSRNLKNATPQKTPR
jgi:hypothetical protein